jgi:hypothetical protein
MRAYGDRPPRTFWRTTKLPYEMESNRDNGLQSRWHASTMKRQTLECDAGDPGLTLTEFV